MIKASALYIVIVLALVIGLLCSSFIIAAYFYKNNYQRSIRYSTLITNLGSAVNLLLVSESNDYNSETNVSLYGGQEDSVSIKKVYWGVFDVGIVKAFVQQDTLFKILSLGCTIDSSKWAALYLVDEDRPFSLSGKTYIIGNAYIPAAGVQTAYLDNKAYQGDKRLIVGHRYKSEKQLPPLNLQRLNQLKQNFKSGINCVSLKQDSIENSFLKPQITIKFGKEIHNLAKTYLKGNIVLVSDTTIIIDSSSSLNNVQIYAKAIVVNSGFHGNCQLFATDSIYIASNCKFNYPSCLGVLRYTSSSLRIQEKISIGENTIINGMILTYDNNNNANPLCIIEKGVIVKGQIYSQGTISLRDKSEFSGSIFTGRFLYKTPYTLYENYLINSIINSESLSSNYLTSELFPVAGKEKKILQWLEQN